MIRQLMVTGSAWITLLVWLVSPGNCSEPDSRSTRPNALRFPNIVMLIVDDLGARDLGCYGSSFYDTPHIDRLASQGTLFTQAYASCPVCSPTRVSLLTGRYPQRSGITDYIGAAQPVQWKRNTRHLPAEYADHLALDEVTLAEVLKEAGYATFFGGKWHLGGEGFYPEDQGFDVNMGGLERGGPYGGKKYFSPYGNPRLPDGPEGEHLPDRLASEAAEFMSEHQGSPFLIYLPFYSVHTPLIAREDLREKYAARRERISARDIFGTESPRRVRLSQDHAVYAAMVEAMDLAVGKVLARIDELGLAEETLVIFTSDNGGLSTSEGSPTSNSPLRAGKGWLYEGGIRTPTIIRWPGRVEAGRYCETAVSSIDYFPTVLDAIGVSPPEEIHVDGRSLLPVCSPGIGQSREGRSLAEELADRPLFWHYPHYGNQGSAPGAAIRWKNWKMIHWFENDRIELFDLATDEGESRNVAEQHPEIVAQLAEQLQQWQSDVGALGTTANPAFDPMLPDGRAAPVR